MLKKFEVTNFKGFSKKLVFDLSAGKYNFNSELTQNGIVNKAIIYGKNGSGKSNLGIALFDIVGHLTDKTFFSENYLAGYVNLLNYNSPVVFRYEFQFGNDEVIYEYEKKNADNLLVEDLYFNGKKVLHYNYVFDKKSNFVAKDIAGEIDINLPDNKLSIVKYIYRNIPSNRSNLLGKMMFFIEHMLWFRCLSEGNMYAGYTNGSTLLVDRLAEENDLEGFQEFLKQNGINYNLRIDEKNGEKRLIVVFPNGAETVFEAIASTGTMALYLFYYWKLTAFKDATFVFIDEFDAFFHYESAELIVKNLNMLKQFQTILTSHNVSLLNNENTRPDCCYILKDNHIKNLANSTDKEIREAHNLEKMYVNGAFND